MSNIEPAQPDSLVPAEDAYDGLSPAAVYLASLQPTGRRSMGHRLNRVAQIATGDDEATWEGVPWHRLQYEHVQAIRAQLEEMFKPAGVNVTLCAVRGVMRAAWRMGLIDAEHYQRVADVQGVTGSNLPAGRGLGPGEILSLIRACMNDDTPAGSRDAAIVAMAYAGGLRRTELAQLDVESLVDDDGEVITVRVLGKRRKERLVYLDDGAAQAVRDWLEIRGRLPGALWWSGRKGGRVTPGRRMSGQAIYDVLQRRAAQATIEDVTPHDLRRSFVSDLLDAGVDISTVADMAGHANIETTRRYDRRGERAKKRAARTLHVPYKRRRII